jgi:glycosyltransferase involved in cell wall biosynthesis
MTEGREAADRDTGPLIDLSMVIPVLNEAEGLPGLIERVQRVVGGLPIEGYELILVDDGSKDATWSTIEAISRDQRTVHGIRLARNFGKEAAVLAGLEAARGRAVLVMDGDGQHPPERIPDFVAAWQGGADLVEGIKTARADQSWLSRLASRLFNRVFSSMTGVDLNEASDFRLLSRPAVDALLALPERAFFFRGLSSWMGYPSVRVDFETAARASGRSKFSAWALARYAAKNTTAFTAAPLQWVTLAGLLFTVFAIALGLQTLWRWYAGDAVEGFTTVILLILIHGGVVMTALGLIGQYIAQIHQEVKHRPRYLVRSDTRSSRRA